MDNESVSIQLAQWVGHFQCSQSSALVCGPFVEWQSKGWQFGRRVSSINKVDPR